MISKNSSRELGLLKGIIADRERLQVGLCVQHTAWCQSLLKGLIIEMCQLRAHPGGLMPKAADNVARLYQELMEREAIVMYGFLEQQRLHQILEEKQSDGRIEEMAPKRKRKIPIGPIFVGVMAIALLAFTFTIGLPVGG